MFSPLSCRWSEAPSHTVLADGGLGLASRFLRPWGQPASSVFPKSLKRSGANVVSRRQTLKHFRLCRIKDGCERLLKTNPRQTTKRRQRRRKAQSRKCPPSPP